jgi:hypothetical protein
MSTTVCAARTHARASTRERRETLEKIVTTHRLGAKRTPVLTTRAMGRGARVDRGRLNVRGALLGDEQDKELWREAREEGGDDEMSGGGDDESLWGRVSKGSAPGATKPFNGRQPQGQGG